MKPFDLDAPHRKMPVSGSAVTALTEAIAGTRDPGEIIGRPAPAGTAAADILESRHLR